MTKQSMTSILFHGKGRGNTLDQLMNSFFFLPLYDKMEHINSNYSITVDTMSSIITGINQQEHNEIRRRQIERHSNFTS